LSNKNLALEQEYHEDKIKKAPSCQSFKAGWRLSTWSRSTFYLEFSLVVVVLAVVVLVFDVDMKHTQAKKQL